MPERKFVLQDGQAASAMPSNTQADSDLIATLENLGSRVEKLERTLQTLVTEKDSSEKSATSEEEWWNDPEPPARLEKLEKDLDKLDGKPESVNDKDAQRALRLMDEIQTLRSEIERLENNQGLFFRDRNVDRTVNVLRRRLKVKEDHLRELAGEEGEKTKAWGIGW